MLNFIRKIKELGQIEQAVIEEELNVLEEQQAYICLNNLYLEIERGIVDMSLHFRLSLERLVVIAYPNCSFMQDWWFGEFQKLPNWLNY